jgi:hypothetical protein
MEMTWYLDFPETDHTAYPVPTYAEILLEDRAVLLASDLVEALTKLTVPQQRKILASVPTGASTASASLPPTLNGGSKT